MSNPPYTIGITDHRNLPPDGAGTYETIRLARKYGVNVKQIQTKNIK
jgi:hypothetical protein